MNETKQRRITAAAAASPIGEAYITPHPRESPRKYVLRLPPMPGQKSRAKKWFPYTPQGLDDARSLRDDHIKEMDAEERDAAARGHRSYQIPVAEACGEYVKQAEVQLLASKVDVEKIMKDIAASPLGKMLCRSVKAKDCSAWLAKLAMDGYSESAVKKRRSYMSALFKFVFDRGQIPSREWFGGVVDPPPHLYAETLPRAEITDEDIVKVVTCEGVAFEFRMKVLLVRCVGGLRASDVHKLSWSGVYWDRREMLVRRPKTDRHNRTKKVKPHKVPEVAMEWLTAWWEQSGKPEDGPIFPGKDGEHVKTRTVSYAKQLRRALRKAGVDKRLLEATSSTRPVVFHGLRHAFCESLADVDPRKATRLTGHADIKTFEIYAKGAGSMEVPEETLPKIPRLKAVNS